LRKGLKPDVAIAEHSLMPALCLHACSKNLDLPFSRRGRVDHARTEASKSRRCAMAISQSRDPPGQRERQAVGHRVVWRSGSFFRSS
jgi:hypothetical protein